jgi:hypothetical protein
LIEVFRDPGRLEAAHTVDIKAVQGSVKREKLRSESVEKIQLLSCERKWCDGNAPGCCGRGDFGVYSLPMQRWKEPSVDQLVTDNPASV